MSGKTNLVDMKRLPDGARQAMASLIDGFSRLQKSAPEDVKMIGRRLAMEQFKERGFPDHRVEAWRHTDLIGALEGPVPPLPIQRETKRCERLEKVLMQGCAQLETEAVARIVFVDGKFSPSLSNLSHLPEEISLQTGDALLHSDGAKELIEASASRDMLESLNLSLAQDGFTLACMPGAQCCGVIHLLFLMTHSSPCSVHLRSRIHLGAGARLQLLESHIGAGIPPSLQTHLIDCVLAPEARLEHVCIDRHAAKDIFLARLHVKLQECARVSCGVLGAGGRLSRREYSFAFSGPGAKSRLSALSLAHDGEKRDIKASMNHHVGECSSDTLIKNVLTENGHGVFRGLVRVDPGAAGSDGKQVSKALLLGKGASMNAKPELEIFNDDVECAHGSAIGELDKDALFYLRSRGIDIAEASRLLIAAFIFDIFSRIENAALAGALESQARSWLDACQCEGRNS